MSQIVAISATRIFTAIIAIWSDVVGFEYAACDHREAPQSFMVSSRTDFSIRVLLHWHESFGPLVVCIQPHETQWCNQKNIWSMLIDASAHTLKRLQMAWYGMQSRGPGLDPLRGPSAFPRSVAQAPSAPADLSAGRG